MIAVLLILLVRKCDCNIHGSLEMSCDQYGKCRCKENVVGKKCDSCRHNFYDLSRNYADGCKSCFCFGHGISCSSILQTDGVVVVKKTLKSSFSSDSNGWTLKNLQGTGDQKTFWNILCRMLERLDVFCLKDLTFFVWISWHILFKSFDVFCLNYSTVFAWIKQKCNFHNIFSNLFTDRGGKRLDY